MKSSFLNTLFLMLVFLLVTTSALANPLPSRSLVILVLGDSLTAGYGLEESESFPFLLEKGLLSAGYNVKVINAGVSGDTTAGGLARTEWALADQPEVVIVELGANDALRGLDAEQTFDNLDKILLRIKAAGCRVILTGMRAPRNLGLEYYTNFDRIYPVLAKRHDVLFYPFFLEGVATIPELNQPDGIHPNVAGVQRIVSGIKPMVAALLDEIVASGQRK